MHKLTMAGIAAAVMLLAAGATMAQTFTDINSPQYWGKTAIPQITEAVDANFALIESGGADLKVDDLVVSGGDFTVSNRYYGVAVTFKAGETNDVYVYMYADQGDDPNDKWAFHLNESTDVLDIEVNGTDVLTLTAAGALDLASDLDITGGDITAPADLTITPTGDDVILDGGLCIGSTHEAGDNNLRVQGTSYFVGAVTATAGVTVASGTISTAPGTINSTSTMTLTAGNGTVLVGTNITAAGSLTVTTDVDIDGGDITTPSTATLKAGNGNITLGTNVTVSGNLTVNGATTSGNDLSTTGDLRLLPGGGEIYARTNLAVLGTLTVTGAVATVAGVTVGTDIDIDGGDITTPGTATLRAGNGTITLGTNVTALGTMTSAKKLTVSAGGVSVTGGQTNDTLTVSGALDLDGNSITAAGTLDIAPTGDLTITPSGSDVRITGNLALTGYAAWAPFSTNVATAGAIAMDHSYILLTQTTSAGGTNTLGAGSYNGQVVVLENVGAPNIMIADATTNTALGANITLGTDDTLTLIRKASGLWRKLSTSDN